jgi:subtilisin-like proprotein convertase family protein
MAAKGKHHKKKAHKKAKTRTVRQPVTQTFTSTAPLTIPFSFEKGHANPYPATIAVSGLTQGTITDVNLIFTDLTHTHHDDLDILLSASNGRQALVMSDVGHSSNVKDIDLTLDDEAAAALPQREDDVTSGTFRPTNNVGFNADTFAAPAPALNGNVALSGFDGADPNGTWQLWVMDSDGGTGNEDIGSWALQITAEVDVDGPDRAKGKKHRKGKRRR